MRSGMTPFDNFSPSKVIGESLIGGNSGNLVYAYSVYRALMTEGTEIDSTYYRLDYTDREIEKINETYDMFVIPLADGFRDGFEDKLKAFASLIRRLKIPVVVVGVGLRAPYEPDLSKGFSFDDAVKNFMDAVLEKSAIVGVRGQITADYLSSLGYVEGLHHMVIGCPSMYMFGRNLNIRDTKITKDSFVCINNSVISPDNVLDFMERSSLEFPNGYFIPQRTYELKMTYFGIPLLEKYSKPNYPHNIEHHLYEQDKVRFFINFNEWSKFVSKADFSFGPRLHGNITSIISGTPSLIIPKDARMRELAEYHNLTRVNYTEINSDTSIWDLIEKADFKTPLKNHQINFDEYLKFFKINGVENIFEHDDVPQNTPFDIKAAEAEYQPAVTTYNSCSREEKIMRTGEYLKYSNATIKRLYSRLDRQKEIKSMLRLRIAEKDKVINDKNNIIADKNKIISDKNKIISEKDKIINMKIVRFIVKLKNIFRKFKRKK